MSSSSTDHTIVVDTGRSDAVWTVAFYPDGMHFVSGNGDGLRWWRTADGQEVGNLAGMNLNAVSMSRDHKWIVCGTQRGASVWDASTQAKVVEVEGRSVVAAIDVAPESRRFATGTGGDVSVWGITTGERLLGPLEHANDVRGVKFSPNGKLIATACEHDRVRVFDGHDGDHLITIDAIIPSFYPIVPLAWSNDGRRIVATSVDNKVKSFDASTGSQLAESQVFDGTVESIALAGNGKFIATFAARSISFLDTSTLSQIGPTIEDTEDIRSIALSPRSSHVATGQYKGKVVARSLGNVLPESYGPFHPLTSSGPDRPTDPSSEEPRVNDSETNSEDGNDDLLELALPSSTAEPLFDYDEPPSPVSSAQPTKDKVPPPDPISQLLHALPEISPAGLSPTEENPDTITPPPPKEWFKTKFKRNNKDPSRKQDRPPSQLRRPVLRFCPQSSGVNTTNGGTSIIAEGRRQRRTVAKSFERPRPKPPAKATVSKDASRNEQGTVDQKKADSARPSHPLARIFNITHQRESGRATISLTLPEWMLCFRSGAEDGMH